MNHDHLNFTGISSFTTKTVRETATSGWDLTGISCSGGTAVTFGASLTAASNTHTCWQAHDTAFEVHSCLGFRRVLSRSNTKQASLSIVKSTSPASSGGDSFAY